jgi:hypothetical protein
MASDYPQPEPQPLHPSRFVSPAPPDPPVAVEAPTRWPAVLGIIAIVLAAVGMLGGVCKLSSTFMGKGMNLGSALGAGMQTLATVMMVLDLGLAGTLLIVGLGLLNRRPWSRPLAMGWAALSVIATAVDITLVALVFAAMAAVFGSGAAGDRFLRVAMGFVGCMLILGLAPPVFFLVWFSRAKIRRDVATWAGSAM